MMMSFTRLATFQLGTCGKKNSAPGFIIDTPSIQCLQYD